MQGLHLRISTYLKLPPIRDLLWCNVESDSGEAFVFYSLVVLPNVG